MFKCIIVLYKKLATYINDLGLLNMPSPKIPTSFLETCISWLPNGIKQGF
jgi:hypothetical protein